MAEPSRSHQALEPVDPIFERRCGAVFASEAINSSDTPGAGYTAHWSRRRNPPH
jgi:hypothetical protein